MADQPTITEIIAYVGMSGYQELSTASVLIAAQRVSDTGDRAAGGRSGRCPGGWAALRNRPEQLVTDRLKQAARLVWERFKLARTGTGIAAWPRARGLFR